METRYNFPKNNQTAPEAIKETIYKENEVTYMADELGLHKVSNPDPEKMAVSLHCMYFYSLFRKREGGGEESRLN